MKPTIQILALGCTLLLPGTHAFSQKICQQTTVYFESGKSTLTGPATRRLDSLIAVWGANEVRLELEGHTDSINGTDVNQTLSEKRIATVKAYLEGRSKARLTTTVFAVGEQDPAADNGTDLGKAQNRRVELKYVYLQDGNLTFTGQAGSKMTFPATVVAGCSICKTEFTIDYWGTDASIAAAGIDMTTTDGALLTTCGSIEAKTNCPSLQQSSNPFRACFSFPASRQNPNFSSWITNAEGRWESNGELTIKNGIATICMDGFQWGRRVNCDVRMEVCCQVLDSSGLFVIRNAYPKINPQTKVRPGERLGCAKSNYIKVLEDPCLLYEKEAYYSLSQDAQGQLWLCRKTVQELAAQRVLHQNDTLVGTHVAFLKDYQPIFFSDTTQVIKVKRRLKAAALYYVLPDADTTFAFERISKRKFQAKVLNYPHKLAFETVGARRFGKDPSSITKRFRPRKQRWQGKVKKF